MGWVEAGARDATQERAARSCLGLHDTKVQKSTLFGLAFRFHGSSKIYRTVFIGKGQAELCVVLIVALYSGESTTRFVARASVGALSKLMHLPALPRDSLKII